MTVETIQFRLTKPALERLIDGEPGIELHLRKQVCREIVDQHFKSLASEEMWRLSQGMTESIAAEVAKVVAGFVDGSKDPTGRYKWFINYPLTDTVERMIASACQKYFNEVCVKQAAAIVNSMTINEETVDKMIERKVRSAVRTAVDSLVAEYVQKSLTHAVEAAHEQLVQVQLKLKLVQD